MNRKGIKKIMLFLLAFMLVFPVYSFGKMQELPIQVRHGS